MNRSLLFLRNSASRWVTIDKQLCTNQPLSPSKQKELNVPGFSEKVFSVPLNAVGPGASKSCDYKNPEYFSYDKMSYFEAEIEMLKFRLPQPSSLNN